VGPARVVTRLGSTATWMAGGLEEEPGSSEETPFGVGELETSDWIRGVRALLALLALIGGPGAWQGPKALDRLHSKVSSLLRVFERAEPRQRPEVLGRLRPEVLSLLRTLEKVESDPRVEPGLGTPRTFPRPQSSDSDLPRREGGPRARVGSERPGPETPREPAVSGPWDPVSTRTTRESKAKTTRREGLSRAACILLRHLTWPEAKGLSVSRLGWVPVEGLREALERAHAGQRTVRVQGEDVRVPGGCTIEEIREFVAMNDKRRFALEGDHIRANGGHTRLISVDGQIIKDRRKVYFHLTTEVARPEIMREGLLSGDRRINIYIGPDRASIREAPRRGGPRDRVVVELSIDFITPFHRGGSVDLPGKAGRLLIAELQEKRVPQEGILAIYGMPGPRGHLYGALGPEGRLGAPVGEVDRERDLTPA